MTNKIFMAFAAGKETIDGNSIKKYIGVAPIYVLAINPTKSELEKLYNTSLENNIEYVGNTEINGVNFPNVRIDFIIKTDEEKCGINYTGKVTFFLRKQYRYNRDETKVQVIDKYGRTCWVTKEQCQAQEIPMYSNGPANIDRDYRPCFVGEEDLTNFIKTYLNIPNVMKYVNNTWVMVDNPQDCEARLDGIMNYFKGDFSELKSVIALQPKNKLKVLFGVRTTEDNKQYQAVYTQMFLNNNSSNYSRLEKDLNERKAAGAYPSTEFEVVDIREYIVTPTDFTKKEDPTFDPFAVNSELPW